MAAGESVEVKANGPIFEMTQDVEITGNALKFYSQEASVELSSNVDINGQQVNMNCGGGAASSHDDQEQQSETRQITLRLHDADMRGFSDKRYRIVAGGIKCDGTTDCRGILRATIPAAATVAQVTLWTGRYPSEPRLKWAVQLRNDALPPPTDPEGALVRLKSLGYFDGEPVPILTEIAKDAIRMFQEDYELGDSGELDSTTAAKIQEIHGS